MTPEQRELRDALAAVPDRAASAALARAASRPGSPARIAPDDATASGEWSAREVALHLAAVEGEVWHTRLAALATETFPHWAWVEPDLWSGLGDGTFEGALAAFAAARALTIARLDLLDPAGWTRQGRHDTYGILDVAALLRVALDHDENHIAQIAAA